MRATRARHEKNSEELEKRERERGITRLRRNQARGERGLGQHAGAGNRSLFFVGVWVWIGGWGSGCAFAKGAPYVDFDEGVAKYGVARVKRRSRVCNAGMYR